MGGEAVTSSSSGCTNRNLQIMSAASGSNYDGFSKDEDLHALPSDVETDDSDDSSSDDDGSSSMADDDDDDLTTGHNVADFDGFDGGFDEDDPMARQMQSILSLKLVLGVDNDKEFLQEHAEKKREREKLKNSLHRGGSLRSLNASIHQGLDRDGGGDDDDESAAGGGDHALAHMTPEERIEYESRQASSIFDMVAKKYEAKRKEAAVWEKPSWTDMPALLKPTAAGAKMKRSGNLQGPITAAPHLKKAHLQADETGDDDPFKSMLRPKNTSNNNNNNIHKTKEVEWEKPEWVKKSKLRKTAAGEKVKKGGDLQAPITAAPHIKKNGSSSPPESPTRNDGKLKTTSKATNNTTPSSLSKKKSVEWEKPEWVKKSKLKKTAAGEKVKKGGDLQAPITAAPHLKNLKEGGGDAAAVDAAPSPDSPTRKKKKKKKPEEGGTQAEVTDFLKKSLKKAKSKRNLVMDVV